MPRVSAEDLYDRHWDKHRASQLPGGFRGHHTLSRFEAAGMLLGGGDHLLDVGCGAGHLIELVGSRFRRVTGMDISATPRKSNSSKHHSTTGCRSLTVPSTPFRASP